eukprot:m51a1_g202 hypothetical protein (1215) ;mRNA; f:663431-668632
MGGVKDIAQSLRSTFITKRDVSPRNRYHTIIITDGQGGSDGAFDVARTMRAGVDPWQITVLLVPPLAGASVVGPTAVELRRVASPPLSSHFRVFRSWEHLAQSTALVTSLLWPNAGHVCSLWGDGNVRTFDGLSYTYAGRGDFFLLQSLVSVAVRLTQRGDFNASRATAVALYDGSAVHEVYLGATRGLEFYSNNVPILYPRTVGNGITWVDENTVSISVVNNQLVLTVRRSDVCTPALTVTLYVSPIVYSNGYGLCGNYDACAYNDASEPTIPDSFDRYAVDYSSTIFIVHPPHFLYPVVSVNASFHNATDDQIAACAAVLPAGPLRDTCITDAARWGSSVCVDESVALYRDSCRSLCFGNISNSLLNASDCTAFCSAFNFDLHSSPCNSRKRPSPMVSVNGPAEFKAALQTPFGGRYRVGVRGCGVTDTVTVDITCPNDFNVTALATPAIVTASYYEDEVAFAPVRLTATVNSQNFVANSGAFQFSWAVISVSRPAANYTLGAVYIEGPNTLDAVFRAPTFGDYVIEFAAYDGCRVAKAHLGVRIACQCQRTDVTVRTSGTPGWNSDFTQYVANLESTVFPSYAKRHVTWRWSVLLAAGTTAQSLTSRRNSGTTAVYRLYGAVPASPTLPDPINGSIVLHSTTVLDMSHTETIVRGDYRRLLAGMQVTETDYVEKHNITTYRYDAQSAPLLCTVTLSSNGNSATVVAAPGSQGRPGCFGVFWVRAEYSEQECNPLAQQANASLGISGTTPSSVGVQPAQVYDDFPVEVACSNRPRAIACCTTEVAYESTAIQTVRLNAFDSFDPDDDLGTLTYTWSMVEAPWNAQSFSDTTGSTMAYIPTAVGTYVFNLKVSDQCSSDSVNQTVNVRCRELSVNAAPNPATLQPTGGTPSPTSTIGYTVSNDKGGEGSRGISVRVKTYPAEIDNWFLRNEKTTAEVISGTAFTPPAVSGSWVLTTVVSDNCGQNVTSDITVSVQPSCDGPTIVVQAGGSTVTEGQAITANQNADTGAFPSTSLDASGSSITVGSLSYVWVYRQVGSTGAWTVIARTATTSFTFPPGQWNVKLQAAAPCGRGQLNFLVKAECFTPAGSISPSVAHHYDALSTAYAQVTFTINTGTGSISTVSYAASLYEQVYDVQLPLRASTCPCTVPAHTNDPLKWFDVSCDPTMFPDVGISYVECVECPEEKYECSLSDLEASFLQVFAGLISTLACLASL